MTDHLRLVKDAYNYIMFKDDDSVFDEYVEYVFTIHEEKQLKTCKSYKYVLGYKDGRSMFLKFQILNKTNAFGRVSLEEMR